MSTTPRELLQHHPGMDLPGGLPFFPAAVGALPPAVAFPAAAALPTELQPFKQMGTLQQLVPFFKHSVFLQDVEILQAPAALPAAGVIPLVAGDLQAVESLTQAAGNLQAAGTHLQAAIDSLSRASVELQAAIGPVFEQL